MDRWAYTLGKDSMNKIHKAGLLKGKSEARSAYKLNQATGTKAIDLAKGSHPDIVKQFQELSGGAAYLADPSNATAHKSILTHTEGMRKAFSNAFEEATKNYTKKPIPKELVEDTRKAIASHDFAKDIKDQAASIPKEYHNSIIYNSKTLPKKERGAFLHHEALEGLAANKNTLKKPSSTASLGHFDAGKVLTGEFKKAVQNRGKAGIASMFNPTDRTIDAARTFRGESHIYHYMPTDRAWKNSDWKKAAKKYKKKFDSKPNLEYVNYYKNYWDDVL